MFLTVNKQAPAKGRLGFILQLPVSLLPTHCRDEQDPSWHSKFRANRRSKNAPNNKDLRCEGQLLRLWGMVLEVMHKFWAIAQVDFMPPRKVKKELS